ncbi:MAG: glycosyltransferase, partial [Trichlorobacter sp.]|nr:glycosyltransferase [Trichlorobacter sp.]
MRIALLCPFSKGPARGNITTVNRIADSLSSLGCQVLIIPLDTQTKAEQMQAVMQFKPTLLHAFHAFHAGPAALDISKALNLPFIITITGSDLFDQAMRTSVTTCQVLENTSFITCFDNIIACRLAEYFPTLAMKIRTIPQGVEKLLCKHKFSLTANLFTLLLPAALRPVKGITEAINGLAPLADEMPSLRLLIAGGVLDETYAKQVETLVADKPWVKLVGELSRQQMGQAFCQADAVLNSSQFEGGMANALLEAMAACVPVIARDIAGNRSLVKNNETGWLYSNDQQLRDLVKQLAQNPQLLHTTGKTACAYVVENFSPQTEAKALLELYHSC